MFFFFCRKRKEGRSIVVFVATLCQTAINMGYFSAYTTCLLSLEKAFAYKRKRQLQTCNCLILKWYHQESNQGHKDFQSFALPTELWYHRSCGCKYTCSFVIYKNVTPFFFLFFDLFTVENSSLGLLIRFLRHPDRQYSCLMKPLLYDL